MKIFDAIWYDEETGKLGISKEKAEEMQEVSYIDFPQAGASFKKGDVMITVEGMKSNFEIEAPFDLEIVEINSELEDSPEDLTQDPENNWIVNVK